MRSGCGDWKISERDSLRETSSEGPCGPITLSEKSHIAKKGDGDDRPAGNRHDQDAPLYQHRRRVPSGSYLRSQRLPAAELLPDGTDWSVILRLRFPGARYTRRTLLSRAWWRRPAEERLKVLSLLAGEG